ncbi:unnamed protein product, partial [Scytosiphon promiscuus]
MDLTNELSEEEQTEYDRLTQEEGDYLAPTQAALMITPTPAGSGGDQTASEASYPGSAHQHQHHEQQQQRPQQQQQQQQDWRHHRDQDRHHRYRLDYPKRQQQYHQGRRRHVLSASSQSAAALAYYNGTSSGGRSQQQACPSASKNEECTRHRQSRHGGDEGSVSGSCGDRGRLQGPDCGRQQEGNRPSEKIRPHQHPRTTGVRGSPSAHRRNGRRAEVKGGATNAAVAAQKTRTTKKQESIKDVLADGLKERLCADNSERFRRTPGSFRKPIAPAEARSAAAEAALAAMGEPMPSNRPPLLPPLAFVSSGFLAGSPARVPGPRATTTAGGDCGVCGGGDRSRSRSCKACKGSTCGGDGGASEDCRNDRAGGDGSGDCAAAGEGCEKKGAGGARALGPSPSRPPMPRKAARPASFEKHTKAFGSRFLERNGFDSTTTGLRENEYVITFADKASQGARRRGGITGGLGYDKLAAQAAAAKVPESSLSAPCDMDPSLQRGNPPKSYYGITVEFPFEAPMVPQDQMMQRIMAALKSKKHALLESPTGTGKSAAFTSAALAWQRDEAIRTGKAPQIIYGARTHTQLEQMVKVLKSLPYCPTMATLGSRSRMCINPMVVGKGLADGEESQDDESSDDAAQLDADAGGDDEHPGWATRGGNGGR